MMKYLDFFNCINKNWATKRDIEKVCGCSEVEAYEILMELDWKAKENNIHVPNRKDGIYIPMKLFLEYLGKSKVDRIIRYHIALNEFYNC